MTPTPPTRAFRNIFATTAGTILLGTFATLVLGTSAWAALSCGVNSAADTNAEKVVAPIAATQK